MKGKALKKHSLHEKTAASVLLKLFISSNEIKFHWNSTSCFREIAWKQIFDRLCQNNIPFLIPSTGDNNKNIIIYILKIFMDFNKRAKLNCHSSYAWMFKVLQHVRFRWLCVWAQQTLDFFPNDFINKL